MSAAKLVQLQLTLQLQEGFQAVHLSGFAAEYDLNWDRLAASRNRSKTHFERRRHVLSQAFQRRLYGSAEGQLNRISQHSLRFGLSIVAIVRNDRKCAQCV